MRRDAFVQQRVNTQHLLINGMSYISLHSCILEYNKNLMVDIHELSYTVATFVLFLLKVGQKHRKAATLNIEAKRCYFIVLMM